MTKFELPEKPKKTNTSEDFNNLRKAVDELDKFDYAWKTHANKADRRINAANKYIEELERVNQQLVAENLDLKTLVDSAKQHQPLPVVPECVAKWYEEHKDDLESSIYRLCIEFNQKVVNTLKTKTKLENWFDYTENKPIETLIRMQEGYQVEKPQHLKRRKKRMTEETELCGFQPTGRSEDVPKPPKYNLNAEFWRTQWSEASGAHLMEYLRAEKLQEQLNTAKKALTEIASTRQWRGGTSVGFEATEDAQIAINALAAIGNEGSGDE